MDTKKGNPLLSVIVPIYNVEPWLRRCVDSILGQTLEDLECILVDDGSPDGCGAIVDEYAKADSRVVAIHQENRGVSAARNAGLDIARGEYVGFVDPDDWVEPEMYEVAIERMRETGDPVCAVGWREVEGAGQGTAHGLGLGGEVGGGADFAYHLFDLPRTISFFPWNKVFRSDVLSTRFVEGISACEDAAFVAEVSTSLRSLCWVDRPLYNVFRRPESASRASKGMLQGLEGKRLALKSARGIGQRKINYHAEAEYLDFLLGVIVRATEAEERVEARRELRRSFVSSLRLMRNSELGLKKKAYLIMRAFI